MECGDGGGIFARLTAECCLGRSWGGAGGGAGAQTLASFSLSGVYDGVIIFVLVGGGEVQTKKDEPPICRAISFRPFT